MYEFDFDYEFEYVRLRLQYETFSIMSRPLSYHNYDYRPRELEDSKFDRLYQN